MVGERPETATASLQIGDRVRLKIGDHTETGHGRGKKIGVITSIRQGQIKWASVRWAGDITHVYALYELERVAQ